MSRQHGAESALTLFHCYECGEPAFSTADGVNHHGAPDEVDHDADHVALDPKEIGD